MADWIVDQSGGGDSVTINGAVALAASNDTIIILRGEYKEEVADGGKNLSFFGEGLVFLQGSGTLAKGFALTGNSSVQDVIINNFTSHGVQGGFLVTACEIKQCGVGIEDTFFTRNNLLQTNTTALKNIIDCSYNTVVGSTIGIEDAGSAEGNIFAETTTCFKAALVAFSVATTVFEDTTITHYANVNAIDYDTLSDFLALFGSGSGSQYAGPIRFFDRDIDFYYLSTANLLSNIGIGEFQVGFQPNLVGITPNVNETLIELGIFSGATVYDGVKVSGAGTFTTAVFNLRVSRNILTTVLSTVEDITGGDKIETTADTLDIEYRGSNSYFEKTNGVIAWQTVERRKPIVGPYRFWQFRFTLVGAAELNGIGLSLDRRFAGLTAPTWIGSVGVDTTTINAKNGVDFVCHSATDADSHYRLYGQKDTDVGLFMDANIIGDFHNGTFTVSQLGDGTRLSGGNNYYFGLRLINLDGVTDQNTQSYLFAYPYTPSPPDPPDIEGEYLGGGHIEITLTSDLIADPNYRYTLIYQQTITGFDKQIGILTNIDDSIEIAGFMVDSAFIFIGIAVGYDGLRSYSSEEARVATVEASETQVENIYT